VFDLLNPNTEDRPIELMYLIAPELPSQVIGDVTRLRQILVNLVGNAIKFTEEGEIFVNVSQRTREENTCTLLFEVRDTGIGIPESRRDMLFRSFTQLDSSTTRKYGGTGLGLAITARLVEMMGGSIWVDSEVGKGSTFSFTLRVELEDEVQDTEAHAEELSGKRVLIVDDNQTNRRILNLQCVSWGMDCLVLPSGQEALRVLDSGTTFDMAIIDMLMPEMDGLLLAQEIKKRSAPPFMPLILLSSLGKHDERVAAGELFQTVLTKPIKQAQLKKVLIASLVSSAIQRSYEEDIARLDRHLAEKVPLRLLIAEDNPVNQKLVVRLFEQMGYRIDVTANGLEVLDALQRQPYDMVFMDIQMPEMDGLEATRRIAEIFPDTLQPIIVAVTANALDGDRERCLEAGMHDYISKPIRIDTVQQTILRWAPKVQERRLHAHADVSRDDLIDAETVETLQYLAGSTDIRMLSELLDILESQSEALINEIVTGLERDEQDTVKRAAHTLKGSALNLGAKALADVCQKMERAAEDGDLARVHTFLPVMRHMFAQSLPVLKEIYLGENRQ
jgi:CheY-like chemotaxis protein/HPt (histidine-containing phosphotransfer) domain-containing protein